MQSRRRRGTTLIEAVLYIAIAIVVMVFSIGLVREDQVRRERTALTAELETVTTAAQTYVAADYENIRGQLLNATPVGAGLIMAFNINPMVAQGFLPAAFVQAGTAPKSFVDSMQYAIAVRAVLRSAGGAIPATLNRTAAITQAGVIPPKFINTLVDNIYQVDAATGTVTNDEIDLEALLITISSDPCVIVPAAHGPRIVAQSQSTSVGYVTGLGTGLPIPNICLPDVQANVAWTGIDGQPALMATGPYNAWRLMLAPYENLTLTAAQFPTTGGEVFAGENAVQAGRFASLLALKNRPPLSESARMARDGDSALRCSDVPPDSAEELACSQGNLLYSDLTFTSWDSDGDGDNDKLPGLQNVNTIVMAEPSDSDGDDIIDNFPGLVDVNTLDMVEPLVNDGPPQITDVLSLSCSDPDTVITEADRFTIDCPKTQMQGLVVTGLARFDGGIEGSVAVEDEVSAASAKVTNRLQVGGVDIGGSPSVGEIILNGDNLANNFVSRLSHTFSGEPFLTVGKPACPTGFAPDISVLPITFETEEDFRGIETLVTSNGPNWRVRLKVTEEEDGGGGQVDTITNPDGSKIVVLSGCKET